MNNIFAVVDEPLIEYVIDQADGKEYEAGKYIFRSVREVAQLRLRVFDAIKRDEPNIICAACHKPVYPRKNSNTGKFHFAHVFEDIESNCPYNEKRSRLDTTRIDSMRYNGQKEGPDHKHVKKMLHASISADPSFDPNETKEEKNWYGVTDEKKWRRPDIAATRMYGNEGRLRIAFEIQLSSTYLKVIAERRVFYLKENALLFWIFENATGIDPRQYQDDLFYNNNSNLFVVDEETVRLSKNQGKLIFRCCYYKPVLAGTIASDVWQEKMVSIDELTIDIKKQRVYWFDYKSQKDDLVQILEEQKLKRDRDALRMRYENYWERIDNNTCSDPENEYKQLKQDLSLHNIIIPESNNQEIKRFTQMIYSAKNGEGFLTGLDTLLEVANNSYKYGTQFLLYFGRVLNHYGNWKKLLAQDGHAARRKKMLGKSHISWEEKGKIIGQKIKSRDPEFIQNRNYDGLFLLLFPEIVLPNQ